MNPDAALIWLLGYPKSGNTWTRFLLKSYAQAGRADDLLPLTTHWLGFDLHETAIATLGMGLADLAPPGLDALRTQALNDYARGLTQDRAAPRWLYSHCRYHALDGLGPFINEAQTRAAIYVVRHPLDVVVSLSHHLRTDHATAVDYFLDPGFMLSLLPGKPGYVSDDHVGDWAAHVRGWRDAPLPVHLLRYEDMLADPHTTFGAMIDAIGLARDDAVLARAVAATGFDKLRALAQGPGFSNRASGEVPFFRKGVSGDGGKSLAPALIERVYRACGDVMQGLGYE